jgi:hypothetical protein
MLNLGTLAASRAGYERRRSVLGDAAPRTGTTSFNLGVLSCVDRGQPVPSDGLIYAITGCSTWAGLWRGHERLGGVSAARLSSDLDSGWWLMRWQGWVTSGLA